MNPEYPSSSLVRSFMRVPSAAEGVFCAGVAADRYDLHGGVPDITEETIHDGSVHQEIPARTRRLSEDHMRNPLPFGELDERVCHLRALQLHNRGAQLLRKP